MAKAKKIKSIALAFGLALVGLALCGAIYQIVATFIYNRKFNPPGELVDVSGRFMHINCYGENHTTAPVIVFESGIWGSSLDWEIVQNELAKTNLTCSYDRAGYGFSERGPRPRTSEQIAKELKQLLVGKGIKPPYILVGHSLGGIHVRTFHSYFSGDVAGVVLVDPVQEEMGEPFSGMGAFLMNMFSYSTFIGIPRLLYGFMPAPSELFSDDWLKKYRAMQSNTTAILTMIDEGAAAEESKKTLGKIKVPMGNIPLVVIARGNKKPLRPGLSKEEQDKLYEEGVFLQKKILRESNRSRFIVAEESSHFIQGEQPEIIVEAIRTMIEEQSQQ